MWVFANVFRKLIISIFFFQIARLTDSRYHKRNWWCAKCLPFLLTSQAYIGRIQRFWRDFWKQKIQHKRLIWIGMHLIWLRLVWKYFKAPSSVISMNFDDSFDPASYSSKQFIYEEEVIFFSVLKDAKIQVSFLFVLHKSR